MRNLTERFVRTAFVVARLAATGAGVGCNTWTARNALISALCPDIGGPAHTQSWSLTPITGAGSVTHTTPITTQQHRSRRSNTTAASVTQCKRQELQWHSARTLSATVAHTTSVRQITCTLLHIFVCLVLRIFVVLLHNRRVSTIVSPYNQQSMGLTFPE